MGLSNWLDRQAAASQAANDALRAELTQRAEASAKAARVTDEELLKEADAMRVSNGGPVPDDVIDPQLAAYRRTVGEIRGR